MTPSPARIPAPPVPTPPGGSRQRRFTVAAAGVAVGALVLAACAPSAEEQDGGADPSAGEPEAVRVGIIYSETGPLAAYGKTYREGLEAGLDYATDGSREVGGVPIELVYRDDGGNNDTAVGIARELIGQDVDVFAGTVVSGIATSLAEQAAQNEVLYISGPAATDALQGVNDYTFRSGRQSLQDVATAGSFIEGEGQQVVVLAQDNAFGQGNLAAVEAVLGGEGAEVSSVLVPEDATEFTPFADQVRAADADLVFVAWAGPTAGSLWQSLDQQGVFEEAPVVTGLAESATYSAYGPASDRIQFLSHYFPGASGTEAEQAMIDAVTEAGGTPDLFTPDGFVAGQMLVHALEASTDDPDAMVAALEGWTFEGPKGEYTIRASDHALVQDMFTARLVDEDGTWVPEVTGVIPGDEVAPPEVGGQ